MVCKQAHHPFILFCYTVINNENLSIFVEKIISRLLCSDGRSLSIYILRGDTYGKHGVF